MPDTAHLYTVPLTIFLIKQGIRDAKRLLTDYSGLEEFPMAVNGRKIGDLYVEPKKPRPPQWLKFFERAIDLKKLGLLTSSASAVLLVKRKRVFALTFGYARHLMEPGTWEENFGLRVTLNVVDPDRIRSLDRKSFDAVARYTREQVSRAVSVIEFGLDVERDLLRAVTGASRDPALGKHITGMDALHITVQTSLERIPALLDKLVTKFASRAYKKTFPWVDQIQEIRDTKLTDALDQRLLAQLRASDTNRIWLAVPELIDWSDAEFRYSRASKAQAYDDLDLGVFLASVRHLESVTLKKLHTRRIWCLSKSAQTETRQWSVYRCLYAEVEDDTSVQLLSDGKWYQVDKEFVARIKRETGRIALSTLKLPPYSDSTEAKYNSRVAESNKKLYALMDRKSINYGGGHSKIEFCDLFTSSKMIVHVKKYYGSSTLSHLFSQGVVSATLFATDPTFRDLVDRKLPTSHRLADTDHRPGPGEYEVVFAIASSKGSALELPFFSRVNLRNAARELDGLGYGVSLAKVPFEAV